MEILLSPRVNTMGIRRKMPDTRKAKLVCQAEFGITSARSKLRLLKTTPCGDCIVLSLISRSKKTGGLAHFDVRTLVERSFQEVIFPEFLRRGCKKLEAQIVGGIPLEESMMLVRQIRDTLKKNHIKITGVDLNDPERVPELILDTATLELFDIIEHLPLNDEEISRRLQAAGECVRQNPEQRLIRLVK